MPLNIKTVELDFAEMLKFKKRFHPKSTCFQIFSKDKKRSHRSSHFFSSFTSETRKRLALENLEKMDIAMMVNRSNGLGRSSANVVEIVAVFVDCDGGTPTKEKLLELAIPPHVIVETSPGNHHAYWLIANCTVAQFKPVQQALAQLLGTDPAVCDPCRAMRLPGTFNWKHNPPFLAKIVYFAKEPTPLTLDRFIADLGLAVEFQQSAERNSVVNRPLVMSAEPLTPELRADIKVALKSLSADDRSIWLQVGMAIHSADSGDTGYKLWSAWSSKSEKFNSDDQRRCWDSFRLDAGINISTLFWMANNAKSGDALAFDEMSMAEMFSQTFSSSLRYERDSKIWYHFTGVIWQDDPQAPMRLLRSLIEQLTRSKDGKQTGSIKRFRSAASMQGVVKHAELLSEMQISPHAFDQDSGLLAVKNGVIELATRTFRDAKADDYLRRQASVTFDRQAKCPVWIGFMKQITCMDKALHDFICRAMGYTLFGHANLQLFFVAIGSGGNGKGVLMHTMQKMLGDYAESVAPNLLTSAYSGNANSPTPALARLYGTRMVVCTELPTGRRLDDAFIKQYAGGDEITARSTYGKVFSFKPEGKLWLSTNELPDIPSVDTAMWRRLKPIPFKAKFRGSDVDETLEKKLENEYSGILNWLLKGAMEFEINGLGSCTAIDEIEGQMRKASDSVGAWLAECCIKDDSESTQSRLAHESYVTFTRRSRRKALSQPAFLASLNGLGYHHKKRKQGNFFEGFRLQV